ncbi:zinc finger dhhc domain-containing protein [Cyclospora cayetanensis]|uniref:Palmitoyltransferase n=1 Tax=Cyclospora cayetanensis TaxID=88456 RepID=A0A1D3D1P3_9EIME|nr:zinc finger dhhc domain-containing protein [Cyclospora cayetanensis]
MDKDSDKQPLLSEEPAMENAAAAAEQRETNDSPGVASRSVESSKKDKQQGESRASLERMADKSGESAPLRYAAPLGGRKGALLRSLPVLFVLSLVSVVVSVYMAFHIAPLIMQHETDREGFSRGLGELIAFGFLFVAFMVCFGLSVFVHPGSPSETEGEASESLNAEMKGSGGIRVCKWCGIVKPDRTHHCRVCRSCILRMDHHCPWLANCVGWGNHKYFMLLLLYGALTCLFVGATMVESLIKVVREPKAEFGEMFALLLGSTLDLLLFVVLLLFGAFHVYLLAKGMTTIEFCEKRLRRTEQQPPPDMWNMGLWKNFNEAFGYNPLLWFLPIDNRRGDGRHFLLRRPRFGAPTTTDLEPGASG